MFGEKLLIISSLLIINVSGSALHGPCSADENCGTLDTFCKNGTCVCRDNFAVIDDTCVPLAIPSVSCTHKSQCQKIMGPKSLCKKHPHPSQCVCKSFHHLYKNQCFKTKWLDEMCDNDFQCYCGEDCNGRIECADHMCACKRGFKKVSRRCIPETPDVQILSITNFYNSVDITTCSKTLLLAVLFFVKIL